VSLVDLQTAREHLRYDPAYPEAQVAIYLNAAERLLAEFLNRRIYEDADALATAIVAVPAALTAASDAYDTALEVAADIEDAMTQEEARRAACRARDAARAAARETYDGIVLNDALTAAILLTLTSLHENRGDDGKPPALPRAAEQLAFPFRVGLGV
jgi:hypothetical protein